MAQAEAKHYHTICIKPQLRYSLFHSCSHATGQQVTLPSAKSVARESVLCLMRGIEKPQGKGAGRVIWAEGAVGNGHSDLRWLNFTVVWTSSIQWKPYSEFWPFPGLETFSTIPSRCWTAAVSHGFGSATPSLEPTPTLYSALGCQWFGALRFVFSHPAMSTKRPSVAPASTKKALTLEIKLSITAHL